MQLAAYTKDEALAFVDAIRLTIQGKTGFKWMAEKLSDLSAFIDSMGEENQTLNAYIDEAGLRAEFESYRAAHTVATASPKGGS